MQPRGAAHTLVIEPPQPRRALREPLAPGRASSSRDPCRETADSLRGLRWVPLSVRGIQSPAISGPAHPEPGCVPWTRPGPPGAAAALAPWPQSPRDGGLPVGTAGAPQLRVSGWVSDPRCPPVPRLGVRHSGWVVSARGPQGGAKTWDSALAAAEFDFAAQGGVLEWGHLFRSLLLRVPGLVRDRRIPGVSHGCPPESPPFVCPRGCPAWPWWEVPLPWTGVPLRAGSSAPWGRSPDSTQLSAL